jgi:hypothetical protein
MGARLRLQGPAQSPREFNSRPASTRLTVVILKFGGFIMPTSSSRVLHSKQKRGSTDKFIRAQNVARYRRLLGTTSDEKRRRHLLTVLAAEQQKQKDAGDGDYLY